MSLHGSEGWRCVWHFKIAELAPHERNFEGNRVVAASYEWDGSAESYLERRKKELSQSNMVTHPGGSGVADIPAKVGQLVPEVRLREPGEDEGEC